MSKTIDFRSTGELYEYRIEPVDIPTTDIEQRLREQGSIEERLRLPISESMFVRRSDMLRALFAERAEAADTIASLRSKLEEAEGADTVLVPRAEVERVTEIANRNEQSAEGDRLAVRLASLREADHA